MWDVSHVSSHHIIHDMLQFHKVSTRLVPRRVTPKLKERHMDASWELFRLYKTRCRLPEAHSDWRWKPGLVLPAWNEEGKQRMVPFQLTKIQKFPSQATAGKVMLTLFWDHQGPLTEHYTSKRTTVTSTSCCNLLRDHLRQAIRSKCGLLITGVLLLHDNTRPHTACVTAEMIRDIHFECVPLPYFPDFTPCDYHIFGWLNEALGGKTSQSNEVQEAVHWVATHAAKGFSSWGIQALVKRWRTCIDRNGVYVEKWQSWMELICIKSAGKIILKHTFTLNKGASECLYIISW
jgi:histone-lysine N-methyltransferase SETMAR